MSPELKKQLTEAVKKNKPQYDVPTVYNIIEALEQLNALNPFWTLEQKSVEVSDLKLPFRFKMISPLYQGYVTYKSLSETQKAYVDGNGEVRILAKSDKELQKKMAKYKAD